MSRNRIANGNDDDRDQEATALLALRLSALEAERETKRRRMENLFEERQRIDREMNAVERELNRLDDDIQRAEQEILAGSSCSVGTAAASVFVKREKGSDDPSNDSRGTLLATNTTQIASDEILTDPLSTTQAHPVAPAILGRPHAAALADDPPPPNEHDDDEFGEDHSLSDFVLTETQTQPQRPPVGDQDAIRSSVGGIGPLQFARADEVTAAEQRKPRAPPPPPETACNVANNKENRAGAVPSRASSGASSVAGGRASGGGGTGRGEAAAAGATLEAYFAPQRKHPSGARSNDDAGGVGGTRGGNVGPAAAAMPSPSRPENGGAGAADDAFSWSAAVRNLLRDPFGIPSFRDHQKEIINATLSGQDVFVIMRTGGGKSLTYQLPALFEGRHNLPSVGKVTFVISPLLSLIQDQEDQMNQFAPGSAVSFTSGLRGGAAEHARRWSAVQDPAQRVCLVLVTPEKVYKSGRLRSEMQKLFAAGRLGRFVVDECHCACQWGHDFRPDYTKLGLLKRHFPTIPMMAVTATASNRVRDDVCGILNLDRRYRFFRSTSNRPNLRYAVLPKPDARDAVIAAMASFIKERHPTGAGIVYAFSRKDADGVADALTEYGVVARSYHSDISARDKEDIHRSWMRNETQVVVATIAFGLGINKPDVRFVLHHTISKSLEAYYQESGRAGRDGQDADCVLYYNPKDVPRMLKMVHGTSCNDLLWTMVRYAQASGNDAVCRAIILAHLKEPGHADACEVQRRNEGQTTIRRDVGPHAKTVARLLDLRTVRDGDKLTMPMLVKEWRAKPDNAPECVRDNPPGKDGLSLAECERIIIALLVEGIFETNVVWTAYDSVVYLRLSNKGRNLLNSVDPKIVVHLPKREERGMSSSAAMAVKANKQAARKSVAKNGEWLSAKPRAAVAKKRKKSSSNASTGGSKTGKKKVAGKGKAKRGKTATTTTRRKTAAAAKTTANRGRAKKVSVDPSEVIELSSGEDDDDGVQVKEILPRREQNIEDALWEDDEEESSDEFEFEDE